MARNEKTQTRRSGFTLPEVLVAVAMVGVLAAVTLPAVMSQVNKSEISRVVQDLQNISQASQLYRTDTGAWPTSTDQLITSTASGWNGPYLARTSTGNMVTGTGATILSSLGTATPSGASGNFLQITVNDITNADAQSVDGQLDAGLTTTWSSTGVVREASSTGIYYYPVAIK